MYKKIGVYYVHASVDKVIMWITAYMCFEWRECHILQRHAISFENASPRVPQRTYRAETTGIVKICFLRLTF